MNEQNDGIEPLSEPKHPEKQKIMTRRRRRRLAEKHKEQENQQTSPSQQSPPRQVIQQPKPKPKPKSNPIPKQSPIKKKTITLTPEIFIDCIRNQDYARLAPIINFTGVECNITCNYTVLGILYLRLTPLMIAIYHQSYNVVRWLVDTKGANVNASHNLPMLTAIWKNDPHIYDYLHKHGAEVISQHHYSQSGLWERSERDLVKMMAKNCTSDNICEKTLLTFCLSKPIETLVPPEQLAEMNSPDASFTVNDFMLQHWKNLFEIACKECGHNRVRSNNPVNDVMTTMPRKIIHVIKHSISNILEGYWNSLLGITVKYRLDPVIFCLLSVGADPATITLAHRIHLKWTSWRHENRVPPPDTVCCITQENLEDGMEYVMCPGLRSNETQEGDDGYHYFEFHTWKRWNNMGNTKCPYCREPFFPATIYTVKN